MTDLRLSQEQGSNYHHKINITKYKEIEKFKSTLNYVGGMNSHNLGLICVRLISHLHIKFEETSDIILRQFFAGLLGHCPFILGLRHEYVAGVAASLVNIIEFFSRSQLDIRTSWSTSAAAARRSRAHHQFLVQVKVPASTCRQGSIAQVGYPVPNPFAR